LLIFLLIKCANLISGLDMIQSPEKIQQIKIGFSSFLADRRYNPIYFFTFAAEKMPRKI
jgi:hypothetical protein